MIRLHFTEAERAITLNHVSNEAQLTEDNRNPLHLRRFITGIDLLPAWAIIGSDIQDNGLT